MLLSVLKTQGSPRILVSGLRAIVFITTVIPFFCMPRPAINQGDGGLTRGIRGAKNGARAGPYWLRVAGLGGRGLISRRHLDGPTNRLANKNGGSVKSV